MANKTNKVWSVIKRKVEFTREDIIAETGKQFSKKEIDAMLENWVKRGYIEKKYDRYKLKFVLDSPLRGEHTEGFFRYEKLAGAGAASIPEKYTNDSVLHLCHKNQADRGTCVGQMTAYGREIDFMKLTNDLPTNEEISKVRRDVRTNIGACVLIHDELYENHSMSAECAYQVSRRLGHVTAPSGSYVGSAVEAIQKEGICLEKDWYTAKTPSCAPEQPYPWDTAGKIPDKMALHKVDGYVQGDGFEQAKEAIYKYGYIYMAIPIYENYAEHGTEGNFPNPAGNCIGAHALCWIGYDADNLYCIHSWGDGWSYVGGISRAYFDYGSCGPWYAIIDKEELKDIQKQYSKVTVHVNTACNVLIGKDSFLVNTDVSVMLERGMEDTILAEPINQINWEPDSMLESIVVGDQPLDIYFTFTYIDTRSWIRKFLDRIFSIFAHAVTPLQYCH